MEFDLNSLSDMLLGDMGNLFPDGILPDDPQNSFFQDAPEDKPIINQPISKGLDDDGFPDWLDLKMDFSFLPSLEGSEDVLDDLLLSEVNTGQSLNTLQTPQPKEKAVPAAVDELFHESFFSNVTSLSETDKTSILIDVLSPPYTPPNSPEGLVPDMGLPSSPVYSPVSQPASPGVTFFSTTFSPNTVFTFVAPIIQTLPLTETISVTVPYEALPVDKIDSLPVEVEDEIESSAPSSPIAVVSKAKKERKRKAPYLKASISASRTKTKKIVLSDEDDLPAPSTKKERKRMQNKDAATRYRNKKRAEFDVMLDEEEGLLNVNRELKEKVKNMSNEINYLKGLMREMFKARGILK